MRIKTNEVLETGLYNEWLNDLYVYEQQLLSLETKINESYFDEMTLKIRSELKVFESRLKLLKEEIKSLCEDVLARREKLLASHQVGNKVLPISEAIRNNHLRDRILNAEKSVFYLRYQLNKLLSLAS